MEYEKRITEIVMLNLRKLVQVFSESLLRVGEYEFTGVSPYASKMKGCLERDIIGNMIEGFI